ncbi:E3 ubiquitin- ligase RNF181 [Pelobates cultripes]|uniref:E3 ubiquitin- ligase RNF181 n=1 Tax=Pelobates cultripes TaxID=61616 RepID=A0AAD1WH02_PELCU|nr:E3 ubiquitin- ligase RNF181 [Pelobates cultripes]
MAPRRRRRLSGRRIGTEFSNLGPRVDDVVDLTPDDEGQQAQIIDLAGDDAEDIVQPEIIDLTGEEAVQEEQSEIIDLTGEDSNDMPAVSMAVRGRSRQELRRRELDQRVCARERSRSRSPLRSPARLSREELAWIHQPGRYFRPSEMPLTEVRAVGSRTVTGQETPGTCSICLMDYESGQNLIALPCCHEFHRQCIMTWLQHDAICPLCRGRLFEGNDNNLSLMQVYSGPAYTPNGSVYITSPRARYLD